MMGFDPIYMIITAVAMGLSALTGSMLKKRFKEYSQMPMSSGLSGKEVAEKMLYDSGITDVQVISVPGQLTDHYNPQNKTVNLSDWVYGERTVAAAAVSAHECGHAIQHAQSYAWLTMRSRMVPMVGFSSKMSQFVIMAGFVLMAVAGQLGVWVLGVGIVLFAMTTLFSLVTLPVEFDASKRALAWLQTANITSGEEQKQASSALKWAASTYVVAALASLGNLFYFIMIFLNRRD